MDRRDTLKLLLLGSVCPGGVLEGLPQDAGESAFESRWHRWRDMRWAGPEFWGNRLQDWQVRAGVLECRTKAPNRTLHCLTHRLARTPFELTVDVVMPSGEGRAGFRVGAKGRFDDYRSAAVHGEGLDAVVTSDGGLSLNGVRGSRDIDLSRPVRLHLSATGERLTLRALDPRDGLALADVTTSLTAEADIVGNAALVSHFEDSSGAGPAFSRFLMNGAGIVSDPSASFGPIYFAQYTVHRGLLKLTAQIAPVGATAALELRHTNGFWERVAEAPIDSLARTARFRIEDWDTGREVPYRVALTIPLESGSAEFTYEGTIAREPRLDEPLRTAVFSCNADHGFPDAEVVENAGKHDAHLALFLGDQFYESNGGFGIQTSPVEEAALDVLHKWAMFGWSYRDLFRHIPSACIPDDHDVYHGNVWGEGGKLAPTNEGWGNVAQDQGGYKMPASWVNAVQLMQTSHLPDPYDATPVKQDIGVYYTRLDYGGVSFAILEDRKFKSAPANVLPPEARVVNGWIGNPEFDIREHRDLPHGELLGERQMKFLNDWSRDWSGNVYMKVALSQTNFAAVHTIPEAAASGAVIPSLPMPEPGSYVAGDKKSVDLDSNGWPQNQRDAVLKILRRASAFHIAGDQHLASVVRHGVDAFEDAGFTFTGPALNNIWPRRWWPPRDSCEKILLDGPEYGGSFFDGLGNRITVHAAANPRRSGLEPRIIRDRVTGYGVVTFDKAVMRIRMECWPRHIDPSATPDGQYEDWPVEIDSVDGDGRIPVAWLPRIAVEGLTYPVLEVIDDSGGELVYSRRLVGATTRPEVFRDRPHTVRIGDPENDSWQERVGVEPTEDLDLTLTFRF